MYPKIIKIENSILIFNDEQAKNGETKEDALKNIAALIYKNELKSL